MTIGNKSQDFLLIEKCFSAIKDKVDIINNLSKISTIIKRSFDLTFNISIVENDTNQFFGMNIYPTINTINLTIDAILTQKSHADVVVEIWNGNKEWFVEIDSIILYDKNLNANPAEITAVLLHEIGHVVYSNSIPQRVNSILRYQIMQTDYAVKKLCENNKIRKLFDLVIAEACSSKNFHYTNVQSERIADNFVVKMGYGTELDNFITKLIATKGNSLINRSSGEMDGDVKTIILWSVDNITELEFRKNKLKHAIQTELYRNPSHFIRVVFNSIKQAFFGMDVNTYKNMVTEQFIIDTKLKIVNESFLDWFDVAGNVKKISQIDIDMILIEVDKIQNNDDRIYVLDRIYDKLDLVNSSIDIINKGDITKVKQSKQTLINLKTQLEKTRERIIQMQIKEKQYGVFIKYPKGYES